MDETQPIQKSTVSLIVLFFAFFIGFSGVFVFRYFSKPKPTKPVQVASTNTQPLPDPTLALEPPALALSGILTTLKGKTEMFTRTADAYAEASTGATVLLGESVATKETASAKIEIKNVITTTMEENAEVVFANLLADNIVLQQKSGRVTYEVTGGVHPVAVRALHALVSIREGTAIINVIDTDSSVTVKTGSVKLALVDNDNNTKVWELQKGERATIDDEARDVRISISR